MPSKDSNRELRLRRAQGYISHEGDALARVTVGATADQPTRIRLAAAAVALGCDDAVQAAVAEEFRNAFADPYRGRAVALARGGRHGSSAPRPRG